MGALLYDGFSHAIVYGIVPAAGPLIVVGAAAAGDAAAREDWQVLGFAIALVAVGAGSAFAGPSGVWGSPAWAVAPCSSAGPSFRSGCAAHEGAGMTADVLDPLIHVPARLRIVATLAALPDGDALSFTRLQNMIGLTPGNLITHLRKLEDAGYLSTEKTGNGVASRTSVALSNRGRAALDTYTAALRDVLAGL